MFNKVSNNFKHNIYSYSKKNINMSKLHFFTGAGSGTPSGIKVCIFGATSSIGPTMAGLFTPRGCPTIMVHRGALDVITHNGDDVLFNRSNPYWSYFPSYMQYDMQNDVILK